MIDTKQVLHYYIGCEVTGQDYELLYQAVTGELEAMGKEFESNVLWCRVLKRGGSYDFSIIEIKPHLRTLDSLTPLELLRFHWAAYAYPKTIEEFVTEVESDDVYVIENVVENLSGNFPTFNAPQFLYLISIRIDLFNLIKTGQAVEI